MRYIVASRTMDAFEIEHECLQVGATNVRVASPLRQVICDLDPPAVVRLQAVPGLIIREPKEMRTEDVAPAQQAVIKTLLPPGGLQQVGALQPVYAASQGSLFTLMYELREAVSPAVTGHGVTAIVIDTGVRSTHIGLVGKVVYEEDFTGGDNPDDVFDHGTGVAYLLAGGTHAYGQESGIAPGAMIMNFKALGDDGIGTDEDVIMALGRALEIWQDAEDQGLPLTDPMYPNLINMSFGTEDDGDPDNPIRLAIQEVEDTAHRRLTRWAAAGNSGPMPGTILLPAASEFVIAVGAFTFQPFEIWQYSARGPVAVNSLIKPEVCFAGVNILTASAVSDTAFVMKAGTSFSCPIAAGFGCLLIEYVERYQAMTEYLEMSEAEWASFIMSVSRKPEGAPIGQDNTYGWGMPMGDLVLLALGTPTAAIADVASSMMVVGMMAVMMGFVAKM